MTISNLIEFTQGQIDEMLESVARCPTVSNVISKGKKIEELNLTLANYRYAKHVVELEK